LTHHKGWEHHACWCGRPVCLTQHQQGRRSR
jgi:hypothetical protein